MLVLRNRLRITLLHADAIVTAFNKFLRKRFLKPITISLIPPGWYSGNVNYSDKAIMCLVYREETDGFTILHARNGREYRPPELPNIRVAGLCAETGTVYEFFAYHFHGHTSLHFCDIST